jgi:hypothetical protein
MDCRQWAPNAHMSTSGVVQQTSTLGRTQRRDAPSIMTVCRGDGSPVDSLNGVEHGAGVQSLRARQIVAPIRRAKKGGSNAPNSALDRRLVPDDPTSWERARKSDRLRSSRTGFRPESVRRLCPCRSRPVPTTRRGRTIRNGEPGRPGQRRRGLDAGPVSRRCRRRQL